MLFSVFPVSHIRIHKDLLEAGTVRNLKENIYCLGLKRLEYEEEKIDGYFIPQAEGIGR